MNLVRVVLEHFQKLFFGHHKSFEWLFIFRNLVEQLFEARIIGLTDSTIENEGEDQCQFGLYDSFCCPTVL